MKIFLVFVLVSSCNAIFDLDFSFVDIVGAFVEALQQIPAAPSFMIKHRSSGKCIRKSDSVYFISRYPLNFGLETKLHQCDSDDHEMLWRFIAETNHWGFIKGSNGAVMTPAGGEIAPRNGTRILFDTETHWGKLFALDVVKNGIIHKGGSYIRPRGGSINPGEGTTLEINSAFTDASRFVFVSPSNLIDEVQIYPSPNLTGIWKRVNSILNPSAEHETTLTIKIGKSNTESTTTSFQYSWEASAGFGSFSASTSMQYMAERSSSSTWSEEITRTRTIRVQRGPSVVTWQYVFQIEQNLSKSVFRSDILADTDSVTKAPTATDIGLSLWSAPEPRRVHIDGRREFTSAEEERRIQLQEAPCAGDECQVTGSTEDPCN